MIRVTFCTVCMNRLHHLKITLPKNIKDHQHNENARFLLLDYNSVDGLEEWVNTHLADEIASQKVTYYKTLEPQSFDRSHSRNLAFKLAPEGLICNVDADNFTGPDFYQYIAQVFTRNSECVLGVDRMNLKEGVLRDVVGRICLRKEDFTNVRGFDEDMQDYGFEDVDLVSRVRASGKKLVYIDKKKFLKAIPHSNIERYAEESITKKMFDVLISHLSPQQTDIILLYNDQSFEKGTLCDNINYYFEDSTEEIIANKQNYPRYLIQGDWESGTWRLSGEQLILESGTGATTIVQQRENDNFVNDHAPDFQYISVIKNSSLLSQIKEFYSSMNNWKKMTENENRPNNAINQNGYGKGIVFKNFSAEPLIIN
ncbi:MAG: hypothetical protein JWR38_2283 [Mucilaginibacter sp.]|nr:hypothetical protein [Mucilaginibacter sp.]